MHQTAHALHLITDARLERRRLAAAAAAAVAGGATWVQVREKGAPALDVLATCAALAEALGGLERVLVNDRLDVALAAGARGVHLAKKSLPPALARPLVAGRLLGVSVHSLAEARAAVAAGADYVTFGSVFPTGSQPGQPAQGLDALAAVVAAVPVPVLAVGGITPANAAAVAATGCAGVAVISALLDAPNPRAAAAALRQALDAAPGRPRVAFPPVVAPGAVSFDRAGIGGIVAAFGPAGSPPTATGRDLRGRPGPRPAGSTPAFPSRRPG